MSSPKVLFGFHAVGVRLKTAPESIVEVFYEPTRRDARMRQFIEKAQEAGVRLIEAGEGTLGYFDSVPVAFTAQADGWQIAPYYHLFGSEEMSQRSDVIQQRMPAPYVMVNPADAATLGVNLGTLVEFNCAGQTLRLPVRLSETLARGQVGLPLGLPGIPPMMVGARVENLREAVL